LFIYETVLDIVHNDNHSCLSSLMVSLFTWLYSYQNSTVSWFKL